MSQLNTKQDITGWDEGDSVGGGDLDTLLAKDLATIPSPMAEALTRAEIEIQVQTAKKWPRSLSKFYQDAIAMATLTEDVAAACCYALPRGGKTIEGPSARLAEIVASAWCNIRVDSRIVDVTDKEVVARCVCLDLERNNGQTVEVRVRITDKHGKRYNEDMIQVASLSALAKARRNGIFVVVPRAYVNPIYEAARQAAVGKAETLGKRRTQMMAHFAKLGIVASRVFAAVGVPGENDITLEHLQTLRGYANAIKENTATIEQCFPEEKVTPRAEQKIQEMRDAQAKDAAKTEAPKTEPPKTETVKQEAPKQEAPKTETKVAEKPKGGGKQEPDGGLDFLEGIPGPTKK